MANRVELIDSINEKLSRARAMADLMFCCEDPGGLADGTLEIYAKHQFVLLHEAYNELQELWEGMPKAA